MQTVSLLNNHFSPHHCDLSITLNRIERTFSGTVSINGDSVDGSIMLHAKDIVIESAIVNGHSATWHPGENDELQIISEEFQSGEAVVTIGFHGTITDAMHGLYPCYFEVDGVTHELLATQFESHHAREVFPCVDEPAAKATYDVILTTETGVEVLGNMPIDSKSEENGLLVTRFQTTPKMSSYLLAWVVGELQKSSATTARGVEVNVWATRAQPAASLAFPLEVAVKVIDFFEDYFGVQYPLPKSDHVALPDFSSGAMENWGLVTYREIALLADPQTTSISSKHYVATVIAHELSHQWFGNLVTMKWWNNLWLNESFATLMEYVAIDALYPDWNVWLDFDTQESIIALRRDAIDGVQPVQVDVHHPDEINTIFDGAIVYAKGARLLRMCENYVGADDFRRGLGAYFERFAYQNTDETDLWKELESASGKDVSGMMTSWISQPGYPVVTMLTQDDKTTLTQQQFFIGEHEDKSRLWPIPLQASLGAVTELLATKEQVIESDDSLRLNVGDTSHFITHYPVDHFAQLLARNYDETSSVVDRLQLLHERTLLARGQRIASSELVSMLTAYQPETTEAVWDIMSLTMGELKKFVDPETKEERKLRDVALYLARDLSSQLGWEAPANESEGSTKLRSTIIATMLFGEDQPTIDHALSLFDIKYMEQLDPNLRGLVLSAVVRHGTEPRVIDGLLDAYRKTSSAELMMDISSALSSSRDTETLRRLVELTSDSTIVRPQDAVRWFIGVMRNRKGRTIAWDWLRDNWTWIKQTYGGDKSYDDFARYASSCLTTQQELDEYVAFFTPMKSDPSLQRAITMGISDITARVELLARDGPAVRQTLLDLEV